jgi:ABC-type sugar transport system ATPase subunit
MLLRLEHVGMSFGATRALDDASFELAEGEVHVLAGENGAGKSTLIKILAGCHRPDSGRIAIRGSDIRLRSPRDAASHGVAVIYQELSLVPPMSVTDNLFLGALRGRRPEARARELLGELSLAIDVSAPVESFPLATRQLIEVAKALAREARIVVMDEPTSALHETEAEQLFAVVERLKARGCGILYVTHRMEEIYRLADRITVLRDGKNVGTAAAKDLPRDKLVSWMVGRDWTGRFPERRPNLGPERFEVKGLTIGSRAARAKPLLNDLIFSVRAGEIVGLAGLQGSGCSEALHGLFGALGPEARAEKVELDNEYARFRTPAEAVRSGVALLTSDRKSSGILAGMSVASNITIASLPSLSRRGWIRTRKERAAVAEQVERLGVRLQSPDQDIESLSGGNQQKALLGRWLATKPRVMLLDEPTRGIDIGAKHEIYELMNRWTAEGMAIVLITSEMEELLALADRILVLHRGRVTARLTREEASREKILQAAMGERVERDQ